MRRRTLLQGFAGLLAPPAAGRAQSRPREVGFLYTGSEETAKLRLAAVEQGLKARGFGADKVTMVVRVAEFDRARMAAYALELVERKPSVILAISPDVVETTLRLTSTVPIVALDLESDPVKSGFVESIAHPGSNLTGLFFDFPEFSTKWLELLAEVIPGLARIGVMWDPATGEVQLNSTIAAGEQRHLKMEVLRVSSPDTLPAAFEAATAAKVQAVLVLSSPVFGSIPDRVASLANQNRLPSIMLFPDYGKAGGLLAYGTDLADLFRQAGEMVGKVLAGARPADMPVERPSRFRLVVNMKAAKALGVAIPPLVLARADEVIE